MSASEFGSRRSDRRRFAGVALDVGFLVFLWAVAVIRAFDGFLVTFAACWTIRVVVFERWRPWRRGRAAGWLDRVGPSKDPADYR